MRLKAYLLICLLLLASWSFPLVSQPKKPIIINDADWPPYFFKGKTDSPIGLGKEVLSICLSELGYPFEFIPFPLKRMHIYIQEGKIDTNIFSFKPERTEYLIYGKEPIYKASYRIITRSDENRPVSKITDLDNMRLGHLAGLTYSDEFLAYVKQRELNNTLITVESNDAMLDMLMLSRIDAFVNTAESILWEAHQKGISDKIKVLDLEIKTANYFFTLSKYSDRIIDKVEFVNALDKCLVNMKTDGRYQSIIKKYGIK